MFNGIIYCATSPSNKKYIGQTINGLQKRKNAHKTDALTKKYPQYFYRAIRKHGFENFKWTVLEEYKTGDRQELLNILNERELYLIQSNNTCNNKIGYNEKIGGNNGFQTEETKEKIRNSLTGIKHTGERRNNIREALKRSEKNKGRNSPTYVEIPLEDREKIIDLHIIKGFGSRTIEKEFKGKYSFRKILRFLREEKLYKPKYKNHK